MTAPWKPGNREPFAAYLCDETALEALRPVASEMGWPPEKCHLGGLRNSVQSLSITASPSILMVDLSECTDPLNEIGALAEVCEPGTIVIAIGHINDVRLYRDLLASGLHDYLLKPLSTEQLREALTHAQAALSAPKLSDPLAPKRHVTTAIVGTRGGCGASMLATSLAWLFSAEKHLPTALLDLDVHFGTAALTLDLEPGRGLTDAIDNPSRIDGLFIERAMLRANDHLAVLSAEAPINSPLMTDGTAFVQLEEEFRHAFEMTVIDLPRNMLINFPHVLAEVNVVIVATELTLAGARDAIRLLSWLKSHAAHVRPLVVANKVQPGTGEITRSDFESSIERKMDFLIPYDFRGVSNAAKIGKTFCEANRNSKASQTIRSVAQAVIESVDDEGVTVPDKGKNSHKSAMPGFSVLKSLVAKATAKA